MRDHHPGYGVVIHEVERSADLDSLAAWLSKQRAVAVDTETTGLNWSAKGFGLRLLQIGNGTESFVVPALYADQRQIWSNLPSKVYMHNAPFDLLALHVTHKCDFRDLMPKVIDTRILAHLLDPRAKMEGGTGHGLKELATALIDKDAGRLERELHEVFKTELKAKPMSAGWAMISTMHPIYVQYAGLDPVWTYRLGELLERKVRLQGKSHLLDFEHRVQGITTEMTRLGIRLDVPYTTWLSEYLEDTKIEHEAKAFGLGCENVNSPKQVADALIGFGWKPAKFTATGQPVVDKEALTELADAGSPLAKAVVEAKRAGKWQTSYVSSMLTNRDADDRVHPTIRSLAARTARMSVSDPPLQQLPTDDPMIRRCLIPDEGGAIGGVDYKAVEMRLLAAIAGVSRMRDAILDGEDIHDFTARLLYGAGFSLAERKLAKNSGFLKVYGGGVKRLAATSGAPLSTCRAVAKKYDELFPEITAYGGRISAEASISGGITTLSGRYLPVDSGREYAALNYMIQSTARDVLAQGLLDLEKRGLLGNLLLPVHDEVLFQAPAAEAKDVAAEIAEVLAVPDFRGIPLDVDAKVYGASWGHGYGAT